MIVWFGFVLCALSAAGKDFITEVGKKAKLECGVNDVTNQLFWYKGSEIVKNLKYINKIPSRSSDEGNSEIAKRSNIRLANLEISYVKETDAGEFRCVADGKTFKHTLAVVSVSVVPSGELEVGGEATLKCLVKDLDQSSKVEWRKPDGSVMSKGTVQLKPLVISDGGTWQCHVTYKDVAYPKSLTITVKESAPETTTGTPSKFPDPKKNNNARPDKSDHPSSETVKLLGFEWWVWAALGAGCLVLILLVTFIVIMCKRVKRKKRKFLTMKRAQQLQMPKKYCQCERQTDAAKPQQGRRREKPSPLAHQPLLTQ